MSMAEHIAGHTFHARRGSIDNAFRYTVDYVLIDPEAQGPFPRLFSRNRLNLASVLDRHHGGPRGQGLGAAWAREVFAARGLTGEYALRLLTQPRFLTFTFNPVSFWLALRGDDLVAVIAEVNNTFGDRHSYLCAQPGFAPIRRADRITAHKVFHVSPFQQIAGDYVFNFDITPAAIDIRIAHANGPEGVIATLTGPRRPMTNRALLAALWRRPTGAFRTLALIYAQALKLKLKGAPYRTRPLPPSKEVS